MNVLYRAFCRVYQFCFHLALPVLPYRQPQRLANLDEIPALLRRLGVGSALLVTDQGLRAVGITAGLEARLAENGIRCAVYDGTCANPTVENVEQARALYEKEQCGCLIAFGGGSPMDCAKAVGAHRLPAPFGQPDERAFARAAKAAAAHCHPHNSWHRQRSDHYRCDYRQRKKA